MPSRSSQRPGPESNAEREPEARSQERTHERAHEDEYDDEQRPLERILPELIRRGLEAGRGPLGRVSESFFPRELASSVVAQLGDIRSGVAKAVAQEVGRFLRDADIASEVRKVLSGLDVEAQVRLRFKTREDGSLKPSIDIQLGDEKEKRPPAAPPEGREPERGDKR
jgi:hypothetical protein